MSSVSERLQCNDRIHLEEFHVFRIDFPLSLIHCFIGFHRRGVFYGQNIIESSAMRYFGMLEHLPSGSKIHCFPKAADL